MKRSGVLVALVLVALPVLAVAQTNTKPARRVTEHAARQIALKEVPGGTVKSSELEREKGHLVYSFDISVPSKPGIEEILVDAFSGKVLSHEHETPKMERVEARKEAKEAKASAKRK